jgi:cephalosporin hydroxylase
LRTRFRKPLWRAAGSITNLVCQECSLVRGIPENVPVPIINTVADLHGDSYVALLGNLHSTLKPRTYVEIGVWTGESLLLAEPGTTALGIDPQPRLEEDLPGHIRVIQSSSDDFFRDEDVRDELGGKAIELAFIDGMHRCEFVLRDFMNLEAASAPGGLILIHDSYPRDAASSTRDWAPGMDFWTGDVWRAVVALRRHRPDLDISTAASPPSGLTLVRGLDPSSRILHDRYDQIVEEMLDYDFASFESAMDSELNLIAGDWTTVSGALRRAPRREQSPPANGEYVVPGRSRGSGRLSRLLSRNVRN